jgi:hypothetical protein
VGRLGGVRIARGAADDSVVEKTWQGASVIQEASGALERFGFGQIRAGLCVSIRLKGPPHFTKA